MEELHRLLNIDEEDCENVIYKLLGDSDAEAATLKPHQRTGTLRTVDMEQRPTKGGMIGDGCGMRKTFTAIAGAIARERFWYQYAACDQDSCRFAPRRPTAVIIPAGLEQKWLSDIAKTIGRHEWKLFRWRSDITRSRKGDPNAYDSCPFDPEHHAWKDSRPSVVLTQTDLSLMQGRDELEKLKDRFDRVLVDECQGFRGDSALELDALNITRAPFRQPFSATIVHNSLDDLRGLVKSFERPGCSHSDGTGNAFTGVIAPSESRMSSPATA